MNELVSLNQIVSEIKFFENQAVVSYWEIGKRLNQAKSQVGHGNWMNWVDSNLGYSQDMANKLMKIGKDFSNSETIMNLTFSKALALTSIKDEVERQDFIENHEVEDMTTRQLQAEIKEYKENLKDKEEELNNVNSSFNSLKIAARQSEEENERLREDLRQEREKPAEVIEKEVIKEVIPEDYHLNKKQIKELEEVIEKQKSQIERQKNNNAILRAQEQETRKTLESEKLIKEKIDKISIMTVKITDFIDEVGGLLYISEYVDLMPLEYRKVFLKAVTHLRDFSCQLYFNLEDEIKKHIGE